MFYRAHSHQEGIICPILQMRKLRLRWSNFPKKQQQWTKGSPQRNLGARKEVAEEAETAKEHQCREEPGAPCPPRTPAPRAPRTPRQPTQCTATSPFVSFCPPWNSICYNLVSSSECFNAQSESFRGNDLTLNLDTPKRDSVVELKLRRSLFGDFPLLRALDSSFENRVWFQKLISPRQI